MSSPTNGAQESGRVLQIWRPSASLAPAFHLSCDRLLSDKTTRALAPPVQVTLVNLQRQALSLSADTSTFKKTAICSKIAAKLYSSQNEAHRETFVQKIAFMIVILIWRDVSNTYIYSKRSYQKSCLVSSFQGARYGRRQNIPPLWSIY